MKKWIIMFSISLFLFTLLDIFTTYKGLYIGYEEVIIISKALINKSDILFCFLKIILPFILCLCSIIALKLKNYFLNIAFIAFLIIDNIFLLSAVINNIIILRSW